MALTMRLFAHLPWIAPLLAVAVVALSLAGLSPVVLTGLVLCGTVMAAVHHAEIIAHRLGEPFGTLILALSVTVLEVGLIVTLMLGSAEGAATLARDTVIAAVMIILNLLVGVCLLIGGIKHHEQSFQQTGVSAALATLSALTVLSLVLPNYTVSEPGPVYATPQLLFVAVVSLLLYGTFVMVQTVRHRDYFLRPEGADASTDDHAEQHVSQRDALISLALLVVSLGAVVLLAKALSGPLDSAVAAAGLPKALVGVVIAALVLAPEGIAATRAALANRLQTSLNLALGSALATIGLTIPAVAVVSIMIDLPIALGLTGKGTVLLLLTLLVTTQTLATGRTTVLQGVVHLVIFGVYLFTTVVP
ncbi:calcium:proton antiporter [Croceicoccus pelagius]|uniref:Ionic transporter y4hA n=1 Tax=Croceicoccus pelagius TaxID=1703341 RepID=A0A917DLB9_9SPHN|nr:ionic transporter y4hA [Croceicoccus pelagius]GGD45539.1 ionic transporter y4hA [Croceicoccus pelagius]